MGCAVLTFQRLYNSVTSIAAAAAAVVVPAAVITSNRSVAVI